MAQAYSTTLAINTVSAVLSFAFMALLFRLGWRFSESTIWRFSSFGDVTKADWCARINSTFHAALVCSLVLVCLITEEFDPVTLVPIGSTTLIEVIFSISIGYFLFDLAVILYWLLPMWTVFLVHHLVALTPYVITQFIYVCHSGQYVLLLFLLVELSTLPLNAMAFLEDLGLRRTRAHLSIHLVMFVTWCLCRVLLPVYLIFIIWTKVVQQYTLEEACLLPSMICAHIIALFCIGVFCFVLTPELCIRLRHGEKEEPEAIGQLPGLNCSEGVAGPSSMEIGGGRGMGAAGGAYHDLESAGPRYHRHENSATSMESDDGDNRKADSSKGKGKGAQIVQAFREGLLPQGDDEGGPGHLGVDRSTSGQMR